MSHSTARHLVWLVILIALLFVIGAAAAYFSHFTPASMTEIIPAPAPTQNDYVAVQKGFQYLISRTDAGFSPASLTIKRGETVRFTNNANSTLALTLDSAPPKSLSRGRYFDFTFADRGIFNYSDGAHFGQVSVR